MALSSATPCINSVLSLLNRCGNGRVFLAGDAAHLMPPFMGKGMCSGVRDAGNLAWKLDLVLRNLGSQELLDTYTTERKPQNDSAIELSLQMGQVSCVLDPALAAQRDDALRAGVVPPPAPELGLVAGIRHESASDTVAGTYAIQGRFTGPDGAQWSDDLLGTAFCILTTDGDPAEILGSARTTFLHAVGANLVTLDPRQPGHLTDADGRISNWMTANAISAVVIRPAGYTFGSAMSAPQLPELIDELRTQLMRNASIAS